MKVDKLSISLNAELGDEVRASARRAGQGLSSWIADAAATKLRSEALGQFLDDYEREQGAFTAEEVRAAEIALGYRSPRAGT